jgi:CDP-diacylglycerol--serine O-phosphatidyltransferase
MDRPGDEGEAWLGPRASEDDPPEPALRKGRGLSLRAVIPNAITAAALCSGLTGIRFAIEGLWGQALFAIVLAGVLDALDGRMARLLKAQSRFGAELDSLADSLSFGMAPALVLFLWSLQDLPRLGWFAALGFAICCALRLARFNAQIDTEEQPHKSAGFLTGVPAPVGAGLAFLPMFLWLASGEAAFREPLAGRCLDGADRFPDDFQHCHPELGFDPARQANPHWRDRPGRTAVCCPADRTVVDAGADLRDLPGADAAGDRALRRGQAAAQCGTRICGRIWRSGLTLLLFGRRTDRVRTGANSHGRHTSPVPFARGSPRNGSSFPEA